MYEDHCGIPCRVHEKCMSISCDYFPEFTQKYTMLVNNYNIILLNSLRTRKSQDDEADSNSLEFSTGGGISMYRHYYPMIFRDVL